MQDLDANTTSLPSSPSEEIKAGTKLAGDDFNEMQLSRWYAQEQDAYYENDAGLSAIDPWYSYMRYVNEVLGFSLMERRLGRIDTMLIIGPGSGREVESFARRNPHCKLSFLEASENFQAELRSKFVGSNILTPTPIGDIHLPDSSQDIVCALSVLHHIPNVSKVVREAARVVRPGGFFLVREPCSSMGDWRYSRSATPNERGISRKLMVEMASRAGFVRETKEIPILFEPINKLLKRIIGFRAVPFGVLFLADRAISKMLSFNDHYWRDTPFKKIGPSSYHYMFRKIHCQA